MPVKLSDNFPQPFSPSVEGVALQFEFRQLALFQHGLRWLNVRARDFVALAVAFAMVQAQRDRRLQYPISSICVATVRRMLCAV
ncbi:MAG: hypothetical protein JWP25_6647 [Bradyrhizobium sp.]|nr:hypothetical protein [Bradyrhizobium sp.]